MSLRVVAACLLISASVFGQDKPAGDNGRTNYLPGTIVVANKKSLDTVKKSIAEKTAELEKLYERLNGVPIQLRLNEVQRGKDKIVILNDNRGDIPEGNQVNTSLNYTEYEFASGKIKNIRHVYESENYYNRIMTNYKTLTIVPGQEENATVEVRTIDKETKSEYKDFSGETRFYTLKLVENQLRYAITKVDSLLRRNALELDRKTVNSLGGI